MFIKYKDYIYELIYCGLVDKKIISTYFREKTDSTFFEISDYYAKDYEADDKNIIDVYDVDFFVKYVDESDTIKHAATYLEGKYRLGSETERAVVEGIWLVNEGRPLYRTPKIEDSEVGLWLHQQSCSEDWVMDDRCSCSKIVDIHECSKLTVRYTYSVKNGTPLTEKEVVEVDMEPEDFTSEMLKYRIGRI